MSRDLDFDKLFSGGYSEDDFNEMNRRDAAKNGVETDAPDESNVVDSVDRSGKKKHDSILDTGSSDNDEIDIDLETLSGIGNDNDTGDNSASENTEDSTDNTPEKSPTPDTGNSTIDSPDTVPRLPENTSDNTPENTSDTSQETTDEVPLPPHSSTDLESLLAGMDLSVPDEEDYENTGVTSDESEVSPDTYDSPISSNPISVTDDSFDVGEDDDNSDKDESSENSHDSSEDTDSQHEDTNDSKTGTPTPTFAPPKRKTEDVKEKTDGKEPLWKNPKFKWIALGVIVFIVVLALLSSCLGGGDDNTEEPADPQPSDTGVDTDDDVTGDEEGILQPANVEANCQSGSQPVENAFDGDDSTAWVCVRSQGIDGNNLYITFDSPVIISSANIVPGFNYTEPSGRNLWDEYRHVTKVRWTLSPQEDPIVSDINPVATGVDVKFPNVATQEIRIMIMQTEQPGSSGSEGLGQQGEDAFAISKVVLNGRNA